MKESLLFPKSSIKMWENMLMYTVIFHAAGEIRIYLIDLKIKVSGLTKGYVEKNDLYKTFYMLWLHNGYILYVFDRVVIRLVVADGG